MESTRGRERGAELVGWHGFETVGSAGDVHDFKGMEEGQRN